MGKDYQAIDSHHNLTKPQSRAELIFHVYCVQRGIGRKLKLNLSLLSIVATPPTIFCTLPNPHLSPSPFQKNPPPPLPEEEPSELFVETAE